MSSYFLKRGSHQCVEFPACLHEIRAVIVGVVREESGVHVAGLPLRAACALGSVFQICGATLMAFTHVATWDMSAFRLRCEVTHAGRRR